MSKPITHFDRTICRAFAAEALAVLKTLAEKHGLQVKDSGGSYESNLFTPKFTFSVVDADGEAASHEANAFKTLCTLYGLHADDLGKTLTVKLNGKLGPTTVKVVGLKERVSHTPILVTVLEGPNKGRRYRLKASTVAAKLHGVGSDEAKRAVELGL